MRRFTQIVVIVALALTPASMPALAAPTNALGIVTGADKAVVAQVAAVDGTSVYDGDIISTQPTGAIRLRLGQSQLVLAGNTTVLLHKKDAGVCVTLLHGKVRFSSMPGSPIEVRALDSLVVRAKGDSVAIGQLSLVAPNIFEVGSSKGDLAVSIDGTDHIVAESSAYRVGLDELIGDPTGSYGKRMAHWIWLPILMVPAATVISLIPVFESPSKPN